MTERRKPFGGITKETFVQAGGNLIEYELMSGIKSDLCYEIKLIKEDTAAIKGQCSCRMAECNANFDSRFIKRVHPKIPLSIAEFTAYLVIAGVLIGLGYKVLNLPLPIF